MRRLKHSVVFITIIFLLLIFKSGSVYSQVNDHSVPVSFNILNKNADILPLLVLDSVLIRDRVEEDKILGIPNRYGMIQEMNIDVCKEGLKKVIGDYTVWRYEIRCPDALSLGVYFKSFHLPDGAAVYLYNRDGTEISGGFTSANNKPGNQLALADFNGNSLIIEYDEPSCADFRGDLVLGYVSKAYSDFSAAAARLQINCPEGSDWQDEKRSVCLMTFVEKPYSYYCTGFLVNNVRRDKTPYFMTASHCISTSVVAATLVTYFNYENSTCTGNDASMKQSLSGAALRANNSYSDFTLLELSEVPPVEYRPYFAGWDADKNITPVNGTAIHHPAGSYKCIALDKNPPVNYPNTIQWDANNRSQAYSHWLVRYDAGADESGSSGCPLFDENKRVIGQLHGGNTSNSFFGKFLLSWDYNSSSASQLKKWLDPDNSGTTKLDGIDYNKSPKSDFSVDVPIACLNTPVFLTDKSKNFPTKWLWKIVPETFEFVNGTSKNSQNPAIQFKAGGTYSIQLIAGNSSGNDSVVYKNLVEAFSNLNVSFTGFKDEITLCGSELKNYPMLAQGANVYSFRVSKEDKVDLQIASNKLTLNLKNEARKSGSFDMVVKVTGSHGNCSASDSVLFHVIMPANDEISQAMPLKLGRNSFYSNVCGTVENNEPAPPSFDCLTANYWCPASGLPVLNNSIWFTFKGTSNGKITIATKGFDTQIAVYDADSYNEILAGRYKLLAAADNSALYGSAARLEDVPVEFGKTYWLQVDGNQGATGEMSINLISNTIEVFPNPSYGKFNLTISSGVQDYADVEVFTVYGKRIFYKSVWLSYDRNTMTLDLAGNEPGMYLFKATFKGLQLSKKLILLN